MLLTAERRMMPRTWQERDEHGNVSSLRLLSITWNLNLH